MMPRHVRCTWTALLTVGLAMTDACAPVCPTPHDSGSSPADGAPIFFALTAITLDPTDDPNVPHFGFDLDDLTSTDIDPLGCAHADMRSTLEPDQNCVAVSREHCTRRPAECECTRTTDRGCYGSVDNMLPTFANVFDSEGQPFLGNRPDRFRPALAADIDAGRNVLLIELEGLDDFVSDDTVVVRILRGFPVSDSCGPPVAGAVYQIDRRSVASLATSPSVARIVNGRIVMEHSASATVPTLWPLFQNVPSIELTTHAIRLSARVAPTGLSEGNFGGWVEAESVVQGLQIVAPEYVSVARGLLGGFVDIAVDGVCDGSSFGPPQYGGISIGFGFVATRVRIDPVHPIVDAPQAGSCLAPADAGTSDAATE